MQCVNCVGLLVFDGDTEMWQHIGYSSCIKAVPVSLNTITAEQIDSAVDAVYSENPISENVLRTIITTAFRGAGFDVES